MNQNISCTDDEAADEVRRDLLGLVCALAGDNDIEEDGITNPVLPLLRHNNDVEAVARLRPDGGVLSAVVVQHVPGGGRGPNDCWKYLSSNPEQHLAMQTNCMTCGVWVRHHKKSEKVKAHLKQCKRFCCHFVVALLQVLLPYLRGLYWRVVASVLLPHHCQEQLL